MPILGLRVEPTYEELIKQVSKKRPITYPDEKARILFNSFEFNQFKNISDVQLQQQIYQKEKEHLINAVIARYGLNPAATHAAIQALQLSPYNPEVSTVIPASELHDIPVGISALEFARRVSEFANVPLTEGGEVLDPTLRTHRPENTVFYSETDIWNKIPFAFKEHEDYLAMRLDEEAKARRAAELAAFNEAARLRREQEERDLRTLEGLGKWTNLALRLWLLKNQQMREEALQTKAQKMEISDMPPLEEAEQEAEEQDFYDVEDVPEHLKFVKKPNDCTPDELCDRYIDFMSYFTKVKDGRAEADLTEDQRKATMKKYYENGRTLLRALLRQLTKEEIQDKISTLEQQIETTKKPKDKVTLGNKKTFYEQALAMKGERALSKSKEQKPEVTGRTRSRPPARGGAASSSRE